MLLYDVFYPGCRAFDRDMPWTYLERLASDRDRSYNGARATCTNGEKVTYILRDGEWIAEAP